MSLELWGSNLLLLLFALLLPVDLINGHLKGLRTPTQSMVQRCWVHLLFERL
jgi:TRAP-type C4-dicarboxylate transport system permease large subunit